MHSKNIWVEMKDISWSIPNSYAVAGLVWATGLSLTMNACTFWCSLCLMQRTTDMPTANAGFPRLESLGHSDYLILRVLHLGVVENISLIRQMRERRSRSFDAMIAHDVDEIA